MIRINLIPIFMAINNEYGTDELIKRLKNILNIDMSELLNIPKTIRFTNNSVEITNSSTNVKHTITISDEYYMYRKDFPSYFTIKYYDLSKIEMRHLAAFKTSDNELLVIDEINEENISNRRITKTTIEDTDFINGTFEKEELHYPKENTHERYQYTEDLLCNKKVSKQIDMPNNLYTYSFRSTIDSVSVSYSTGYIESSSSINRPQLPIAGRIRNNNELLISSIRTPVPNILIRGRNVIPGEEIDIDLYNIYIYKVEDNIQIVYSSFLIPSNTNTKEEFHLTSKTSGKITTDDIDTIIEFISKNLDSNVLHEIKQELLGIRKQILIKNKQSTRDFDFFDSRFLLFNQFEYLVFDVYENLSYYETMINKTINPNNGDKPPTLRKI